MARSHYVDLHAVNISAHPHPSGTYEALIDRIFKSKQPVHLRSERYALMTELNFLKAKKGERVAAYGILSTFTDIDLDAPWLNQLTGKIAEDEDTRKITIPEGLRPNFAQFLFHFDFGAHVLAFQGISRMPLRAGGTKRYVLTPGVMKSYLDFMVAKPEVFRGYERIEITIIPDPDAIQEILSHPNIRELSVTVTAPNSDNIAKERGRVARRLKKLKAAKKIETYTAQDSDGIKPDGELEKLARVGALDGKVTARVATNDGVMPLSTEQRPLVERVTVDSAVDNELAFLGAELERLAKRASGD